MNRQEIIEQLKLIQAGLTQDDNNKSKNKIDAVIENLKQPITLAELLGWEENVEYEVFNSYYKITNNELYTFYPNRGEYRFANIGYEIKDLINKKEIKAKKFLLTLKSGYEKLFKLREQGSILTMDTETGEVYFGRKNHNFKNQKVLFTDLEMKKIKADYGIDFSMFHIFSRGCDE